MKNNEKENVKKSVSHVTWYAIERVWRGGQYPYPSLFESTGVKKDRIRGTDS